MYQWLQRVCLSTFSNISSETTGRINPQLHMEGNESLFKWFWSHYQAGHHVDIYEPRHEYSNYVACPTSKASDQPAHTRSLIRAFTSRLNILWVVSYWLSIVWSFSAKRRLHRLVWVYTCQNATIVGNHMSWLIWYKPFKIFSRTTRKITLGLCMKHLGCRP